MAYESSTRTFGHIVAGTDLTDFQYHVMKIDSADSGILPCAATTDIPVGVLQYGVQAGEAAEICYAGITKIKLETTEDSTNSIAAQTVRPGNILTTSANGQALKTVAGASVTSYSVAVALESGTDGDVVPALMRLCGRAK